MIKDLVVRTRALLHEGGEISRRVDRELAVTLNLFRKGGDAILDGIVAQDYDVLRGRPVVLKVKKLGLLAGSLLEKNARGDQAVTVPEAYAICREIAKREAKNFYYAFRVLPRHKSDAMCAIYAFMRRADDIADDESLPIEQRRVVMAQWVEAWRATRSGIPTEDAVFLALNDTQKSFEIPDTLLEELVQGTTMDLQPQTADITGVQTFATFDDLYRYCYLVASVVGLVCIRVFGYTDQRAEKLAEETGVAFQLTNILRDVKEDAERGRIIFLLDMLAKFQVTEDRIHALSAGAPMEARERSLLGEIGNRAESFYKSADRLLPMIDADSRSALWVLVTIYHGLLRKIDRNGYEVFHERISVPTSKKLGILARGAARSLGNRVLA